MFFGFRDYLAHQPEEHKGTTPMSNCVRNGNSVLLHGNLTSTNNISPVPIRRTHDSDLMSETVCMSDTRHCVSKKNNLRGCFTDTRYNCLSENAGQAVQTVFSGFDEGFLMNPSTSCQLDTSDCKGSETRRYGSLRDHGDQLIQLDSISYHDKVSRYVIEETGKGELEIVGHERYPSQANSTPSSTPSGGSPNNPSCRSTKHDRGLKDGGLKDRPKHGPNSPSTTSKKSHDFLREIPSPLKNYERRHKRYSITELAPAPADTSELREFRELEKNSNNGYYQHGGTYYRGLSQDPQPLNVRSSVKKSSPGTSSSRLTRNHDVHHDNYDSHYYRDLRYQDNPPYNPQGNVEQLTPTIGSMPSDILGSMPGTMPSMPPTTGTLTSTLSVSGTQPDSGTIPAGSMHLSNNHVVGNMDVLHQYNGHMPMSSRTNYGYYGTNYFNPASNPVTPDDSQNYTSQNHSVNFSMMDYRSYQVNHQLAMNDKHKLDQLQERLARIEERNLPVKDRTCMRNCDVSDFFFGDCMDNNGVKRKGHSHLTSDYPYNSPSMETNVGHYYVGHRHDSDNTVSSKLNMGRELRSRERN